MNILEQLNLGMAEVVGEVHRSLVQISRGSGNGAGTIWHSDGLIITNAHVVSDEFSRGVRRGRTAQRGSLKVTLSDGREFAAQVIAKDDEQDIAALAIDAHDLPTIQLGDSRKLTAGQFVFAVGHPWGVMGAASAGTVIGVGADMLEFPTNGREWVVMDLKVRPGNSGGPLVNSHGRLVGINTIMAGAQIGAAVPVHTIKAFLKDALGSGAPEFTPNPQPQPSSAGVVIL